MAGQELLETSEGPSHLHGLGDFTPSGPDPEASSKSDDAQSQQVATASSDEGAEHEAMARDLCIDNYWNRLWIVQEIGQAQRIEVCFGKERINWDDFIHFITMHNVESSGPLRLNRQRKEKYQGQNTFRRLLEVHKEASRQEPRDKIYGLVGLASDARGFPMDYDKSLLEVWSDVMEFMNERHLLEQSEIVSVAALVKYLLMGTTCPPIQQIARPYIPESGDNILIENINSRRVFKLQAYVIGCVKYVGPSPNEIIASLEKTDVWTQCVEENFRKELSDAHYQSDKLHRTVDRL
ncbi:uncharacterized protein BCR38DRAFT_506264 [Pseudomassariella vexata]|uniref:Heterokaryon incompatibility domain-containing protein n=1 Tax=Pseudomassariella vexata TaxID=1141098 RepID=A0A1Y2D7V8_9PEZI|nr:uncharacterized protein BCR38DRAFT_506264 [Pseudomassariella vexata]ORY55264.1 hypothetical protein BCR38DRAFT_506264 [Pseudomassariella vexata]